MNWWGGHMQGTAQGKTQGGLCNFPVQGLSGTRLERRFVSEDQRNRRKGSRDDIA
jgi:hypothetical protein